MNNPRIQSRIAEGKQKAANARNPTPGDLVVRVAISIRIWLAMGPGRDWQTFTISLYCVSFSHSS